ncbi:hypothetical protein DFH94DRAFT_766303 [Russula ochroleuca]|uniref:Uncharacterized protein n=1 Tax=Russula ochroleuca TaxID=152965 RepID=A0A9P5JYX3_9AGAM|nr:hypothetical protein DFH94DRAFT_766303 [Russula ochroleuca]
MLRWQLWTGGLEAVPQITYFHDQPLLHPNVTNQHVIIWYFEDWLKKYFLSTVPSDTRGITRNLFPSRASGSRIPQAHSSDALLRARMQSLALIATLCSHPEQEQKLLRLVIRKKHHLCQNVVLPPSRSTRASGMKVINSTNYGINYATNFPASPMVPRIYSSLYTTLLDLRLHCSQ